MDHGRAYPSEISREPSDFRHVSVSFPPETSTTIFGSIETRIAWYSPRTEKPKSGTDLKIRALEIGWWREISGRGVSGFGSQLTVRVNQNSILSV